MQIRPIENFLQAVKLRVESLIEAERLVSERLAPNFNLFDFFKGGENEISRCLACLLDPTETHGQGNKFLKAFVKHLGCQLGQVSDWMCGSPRSVQTERATDRIENSSRRIDIAIEWSHGILGIENKPWAIDQDRQLEDYALQLQTVALGKGFEKHWLLMYLCDHQPDPSSLSNELRTAYQASGNYVEINYQMLCAWLDECAKESKALVVRIFIEELAKYIRSSVMGELDKSIENEVAKLILENYETAFQISRAFGAAQNQLLNRFFSDLENELGKQNHHKFILRLDKDSLDPKKGRCSFSILDGNFDQKKSLAFEFEGSGFSQFFWGIARQDSTVSKNETWPEIMTEMNTGLKRQGRMTDVWPWWVWAEPADFGGIDIRNWSNTPAPWQAINDGRLVRAIVEIACNVYGEVFKNKEQLLR